MVFSATPPSIVFSAQKHCECLTVPFAPKRATLKSSNEKQTDVRLKGTSVRTYPHVKWGIKNYETQNRFFHKELERKEQKNPPKRFVIIWLCLHEEVSPRKLKRFLGFWPNLTTEKNTFGCCLTFGWKCKHDPKAIISEIWAAVWILSDGSGDNVSTFSSKISI